MGFHLHFFATFPIDFFFKLYVFFQMFIRFIRCIYFNRPVNTILPNKDKHGSVIYNPAKWCNLCKINVIEKDHHCWFLSTCISKKTNHTDFMLFLFWSLVGCLYTIPIRKIYSIGKNGTVLSLFLPGGIVTTLLGWISFRQLYSLFEFYFFTAATLFCIVMIGNYYQSHKYEDNKFLIFQQTWVDGLSTIFIPVMEATIRRVKGS